MAGNGRLREARRHLTRFRLITAARLRASGRRRAAQRLVRPSERAYLERLESYDLLVSTGGTYLVEHYEIWGRLLELELVVALGRPLVLFTQSLGPFAVGIHRHQVRAVLRRARLVLLRDQRSRTYLEAAGAETGRVLVRPDAAFVFADPAGVRRTAPRSSRVAISVRDWAHHRDGAPGVERYLDAVASACEALVSRGNEITFVSTCQGVPEYSADDARCAARVLSRLDGPVRARCSLDDAFHTPAALARMLADFDAFISTRMHGAILAFGVGVPVLPIAYEFKTTELFTRLGLQRWLTDIDTIEPASFTQLVERFFDELPQITEAIRDPVLAEHAAALEVVADLRRAAA
jgi:colanic acid/amylovoran biosynthesis protein